MRTLAPNWASVPGSISGKSPLQWAAFYGNSEMAELLLANGAAVDYMVGGSGARGGMRGREGRGQGDGEV